MSSVPTQLQAGDSLHAAFEVLAALEAYDSALAIQEDNPELLWRAARECVAMGVMVDGTELQNSWFIRGEEYAQRAVDMRPNDITMQYWLLAAKGRRAVQSDALTTARLATEVRNLSNEILSADSLHAGATNALGVLNYEVMKLSAVKRFIGRRILGSRAFDGTSWENAYSYLRRATVLDPENTLFWLDLGKLHVLRKEQEAARIALSRALEISDREPTDSAFKAQATQLLAELGSR